MDKRAWKVFVAFILVITMCVGLSSATKDGEIVSVQVEPELSVSGQYSTHTIIVKNTGTEYICFQLESWSWETEFWLDVGNIKTISWKRSMGEPEEITYPYKLYWDAKWPSSNVLLDTLDVKRRCFSVEEVSDNDHDNLMYYVEVEELGTDPNDPDTDGDGKRDDVDERPTTPEGSISITSEPSGASVYLDGTHIGKTPISLDDVVSESHTIKLTKSGYNSKTLSLSLSPGGVENIRELLEPLTGSISISSDPCGANIYLDGAYKGTTPKTISDVLIGFNRITHDQIRKN
jgi:hypothetical protein